VKTDMKRWFRLFATLRNKTRAHGATLPEKCSLAAIELAGSIAAFSVTSAYSKGSGHTCIAISQVNTVFQQSQNRAFTSII
jgi:hypothetical protein